MDRKTHLWSRRATQVRGRLVFLALATGGCGDSAPAEVVALRFQWPPGSSARVESGVLNVQDYAGVADTSGGRFAYLLHVEPHERGLLLRVDSFEPPPVPDSGPSQAFLSGLLANVVPSVVVSDQGELVEVVGIDQTLAYIRQLIADSLPQVDSPAFDEWMDATLNERTLSTMFAEEWAAQVGFWVGGELELGALYEAETEESLPMLPDVTVPFRVEFGAARLVPCVPDAGAALEGVLPADDCVELVLRSRPDPSEIGRPLEEMLNRLLADAAGPVPAFSYDDIEIDNEVVLVTEPESLVPHRMTSRQSVDMTITIGRETERGSQTRVREYVWRWQPR